MTDNVRRLLELDKAIEAQEDALFKHSNWNEMGAHSYNPLKLNDQWSALNERLTEPELYEYCKERNIINEKNMRWTDTIGNYWIDTVYVEFDGEWETFVCPAENGVANVNEELDRMTYETMDDARNGHMAMVEKWRAKA